MSVVKFNAKVKISNADEPSDEQVTKFDKLGRKVRVNANYLMFDYVTGTDAPDALHVKGLDHVIDRYRLVRTNRGRVAKLIVSGFASSRARDPKFDNLALARRRADKVRAYLVRHGVDEADISEPRVEVKGQGDDNNAEFRSTRVSFGLVANNVFEAVWTTAADSKNPFRFRDDELQIWDIDWELGQSYRVAPHGSLPNNELKPDPVPGEPLTFHKLNVLTGPAGPGTGDPDVQGSVSLIAFNRTVATFQAFKQVAMMNGSTVNEKIPYFGLGDGTASDGLVAVETCMLIRSALKAFDVNVIRSQAMRASSRQFARV